MLYTTLFEKKPNLTTSLSITCEALQNIIWLFFPLTITYDYNNSYNMKLIKINTKMQLAIE